MKDQHSENLLNAIEGNPASGSEPRLNELEFYQPHTQTSDQLDDEVYTGQGYYQYHDPQHQHLHQPSVQMYDQTPNGEFDAGQSYDPYVSQLYQPHHSPAHNPHIYKQSPADGFTPQYADMSHEQYQEQQEQYERELRHRQSYNQGYDQDQYGNNYRNY